MAIRTALLSMTAAAMGTALTGGTALAGTPCGAAQSPCDVPVQIMPDRRVRVDSMSIENRTPYDHLDSVNFQRSPHVSILRVHGLEPTVGLSDAPAGFTEGCHPTSTTYCRTGHAASAPSKSAVISTLPSARASASARATTYAPAVISTLPSARASASASARTYAPAVISTLPSARASASASATATAGTTSRFYAPSTTRRVITGSAPVMRSAAPRVYGSTHGIIPGIAHVPTSIVDRDPYRAQAVLDSGRIRPNPVFVPGGVTPALVGVPVRSHVPPTLPLGYSAGSPMAYSSAQASAHGQAFAPAPVMAPVMAPTYRTGRYGNSATATANASAKASANAGPSGVWTYSNAAAGASAQSVAPMPVPAPAPVTCSTPYCAKGRY